MTSEPEQSTCMIEAKRNNLKANVFWAVSKQKVLWPFSFAESSVTGMAHLDMVEKLLILTYSMVQSPSWEANWFAASQKIPRVSRNPMVHYRTHKRPLPVSILGQPNSVHIPTAHILEIHSNIIHPSTPRSPQWFLPSGFPTKNLYTPLSSPIRATCPAYPILLDFITRTILGEEHKSFNFSLCNLLHSQVTSSLLGPNILLNTMFSNTLSFLSSRNVSEEKLLIPIYFWKKVLMTCYSSKTEPLNIFTSHTRTSCIETFHKNSNAKANIYLGHFLSLHLNPDNFYFSWSCITDAVCASKFCTPMLEQAARMHADATTVNTCSQMCRLNSMCQGTYSNFTEHSTCILLATARSQKTTNALLLYSKISICC